MRAYFDLSFEKWYLSRKHQIDPDIWCIWKDGITARLPEGLAHRHVRGHVRPRLRKLR
jgi:hypothetical protein